MMNKHLNYCAIICIFVSLTGCTEEELRQNLPAPGTYLPLNVGNEWTFIYRFGNDASFEETRYHMSIDSMKTMALTIDDVYYDNAKVFWYSGYGPLLKMLEFFSTGEPVISQESKPRAIHRGDHRFNCFVKVPSTVYFGKITNENLLLGPILLSETHDLRIHDKKAECIIGKEHDTLYSIRERPLDNGEFAPVPYPQDKYFKSFSYRIVFEKDGWMDRRKISFARDIGFWDLYVSDAVVGEGFSLVDFEIHED